MLEIVSLNFNPSKSRLLSYLLLIATSLLFTAVLIIITFVLLYQCTGFFVFACGAGVAYFGFVLILIAWVLNYFIYKKLIQKFNLPLPSKITRIIISSVIIMFALPNFWLPAFDQIRSSYGRLLQNSLILEMTILNENIFPNQRDPNDPASQLYNYQYQISINNKTKKIYRNMPLRIFLELRNKPGSFRSAEERHKIDIIPGENILQGQIPINPWYNSIINPSDQILLSFYINEFPFREKLFNTQSQLTNWYTVLSEEKARLNLLLLTPFPTSSN